MTDDPTSHYKAVIGPKNHDYYLSYFRRADAVIARGAMTGEQTRACRLASLKRALYRRARDGCLHNPRGGSV